MKNWGELCYILGIEMIRNEGGIWLSSQKKYGLDMLMKYGMADCTQVQVRGYTNFDCVVSSFDHQSTSGYMFSFGSAAVTWSSKKQPTVALSSIEAEYRGVAIAACEVAWLEMLLRDLEIQVQDPIVIYCDNLSRIQLAWNPVFHALTKHIEIHYHFIRERVLNRDIDWLTLAQRIRHNRPFHQGPGHREATTLQRDARTTGYGFELEERC
ncbi:hypothetical protein L7F22_021093 [Adiantum nelumboides]|nr:hypothetical protein [Adiantum nelumboides]